MAHILFITHWYPTTSNPVSGIFIREHARAAALFHKVSIIHIIGINKTNSQVENVVDGSLTVYRLNYPKPIIPRTGWLYRFFGARCIFQELIRTHNRPDLIHANVYSSSDLAYLLGKTFHCPAVLSEHASVYPRNLLSVPQLSYYRYFMNKLGLIMPVSVDLQHHMEKAGFRGPFKVIPNAVDTMLFHPATLMPISDEQPIIILHVAMLQPIKGTAYLLEAFAKLRKMDFNCVLWIVGDGPERQRLRELAENLHITPSVSFLGIQSKGEIADLMRQADLFALTSLWENQPVALIEAMASGLPVIAPAIGGIPEIVRPENGLLFDPGNVDNLVEKLSEMITHMKDFSPAESARYAQDSFGLQAIGKRFADVYEQLLTKAH